MYMRDSEEESELEELRRLLERTTHELVANGARGGDVSTTTLRRLPDGQNESSVELFYRRKAEAEHAQQVVRLFVVQRDGAPGRKISRNKESRRCRHGGRYRPFRPPMSGVVFASRFVVLKAQPVREEGKSFISEL